MQSSICTQASIESPEFQAWATTFGRTGLLNRKAWEWCFIAEALRQHGSLRPGAFGLGFAVGGEPLVSCFASKGAHILATDLDLEKAQEKGWVDGNQHAQNKPSLNAFGLCPPNEFERRVQFEFSDMNAVPRRYHNAYDFLWSSCALEHLGSIELGAAFIYESVKCLKRGGIAVHTTEFNVSSNDETVESGATVLFRRKDIETILQGLADLDCNVSMNWDMGTMPKDYYIDLPPYGTDPHMKLRLGQFTITSIGIVIVKM